MNLIKNESVIYFNSIENPNDVFPHPGFYRDGIVYGVHIYRDGIKIEELYKNGCIIRIEEPGSRVYAG